MKLIPNFSNRFDMSLVRYWIKKFFAKFGLIIRKEDKNWVFYPFSKTPQGIYQDLLRKYKIDLILDIGASSGYWSGSIRENGYKGRIISFEPQNSLYNQLRSRSQSDSNWEIMNLALGDCDKMSNFYISKYRESSSLSKMLKTHSEAFRGSSITNKKIQVTVQKLDSLLPKILHKEAHIFAKVDVQGYEKKVLIGATESLKKIKMIQLEISLRKLYDDDVLFHEMYESINDAGYQLIHMSPGFTNEESHELLQVDAIFVNKTMLKAKV